MTLNEHSVTDCFVKIVVGSRTLSLEEVRRLSGFEPSRCAEKGKRAGSGKFEAPWNYVVLSTEMVCSAKTPDAHLACLDSLLPEGILLDRLRHTDCEVHAVMYWWTTRPRGLRLSPDSLRTMARVGVDWDLSILVDDTP